MGSNWKNYAIATLAVALFVSLWVGGRNPVEPIGAAIPAAPAAEVKNTPKVETPVAFKSVPAYPKSSKQKLGLPDPVQKNDNKQVIEAAQIPADDHKRTVSCVQDTQTGQADIYVRRDPLPLLAFDYGGDAGLYFGLRNGAQALRFEARQGFFTVKEIHFGALGSIEQQINGASVPPVSFIGGGLWGSWK